MKIALSTLLDRIDRFALITQAAVLDDLKAKHPTFADQIDYLASQDPSPNKKLLPYATKILVSKQALPNEIADVIKLFHQFSHKLDNKDINQWNFTKLRDKLFEIRDFDAPSKSQQKKELKDQIKKIETTGAQKLYEDDQCELLYVPDKATACFYGKGTKWCITMSNERYFEDYSANNVVFYYVLRKDLVADSISNKVAFAVQRDQDNQIITNDEPSFEYGMSGGAIQAFLSDDTQIDPEAALYNVSAASTILNLIKQDAPKRPMGFLARVNFKPETLTKADYAKNLPGNEATVAAKTSDPQILAFLAKSKDRDVRNEVVRNKNVSTKILDSLVYDESSLIRKLVAQNPKTSPEVLAKLADDNDSRVVRDVAYNSQTPSNILQTIFDKYKSSYPMENSDWIFGGLAANSSSPPDLLFDLAENADGSTPDSDDPILNEIAKNPNSTPQLLDYLSKRYGSTHRMTLALNPNTPPATLNAMAKDGANGFAIQIALAQNPATPLETLMYLVRVSEREDPRSREQLLKLIMAHPAFPFQNTRE